MNSFEISFSLVLLFVACAAILIGVRNILVYRTRIRRIDWLFDPANKMSYSAIQRDLAAPSYDEMLFDLRKWTYSQFYPEEKA